MTVPPLFTPRAPTATSLAGVLSIRHRTDSGWAVCEIGANTAVGVLPAGVQEGDEVNAQGRWREDARFGLQFAFTSLTATLPSGSAGTKRYLASHLPGIGPVYSDRMIRHFGDDVFRVLDAEPERIREVKGIGARKAEQIMETWTGMRTSRDVDRFFVNLGVTGWMERRIFAAFVEGFGEQYKSVADVPPQERRRVMEEVRANPYCLIDIVDGIGFRKADVLAGHLEGYQHDSPERARAGLLHVLKEAASQAGHCYLRMNDLTAAAAELLYGNDATAERLAFLSEQVLALRDREKVVVGDEAAAGPLFRKEKES